MDPEARKDPARVSDASSSSLDRRRFLSLCGRAALIALAPVPWQSALAGPVAPRDRRLALFNTHTGESLACAYREGGIVLPDALDAVSHILRDHRTDEVKPIDPGLLDWLADLAKRLGAREPFHIISGYRSPATNAALRKQGRRVASRSFHLQGKAVDVRLPGIQTAVLWRAALREQRGGVGHYPRSDFVHLDTGPIRQW